MIHSLVSIKNRPYTGFNIQLEAICSKINTELFSIVGDIQYKHSKLRSTEPYVKSWQLSQTAKLYQLYDQGKVSHRSVVIVYDKEHPLLHIACNPFEVVLITSEEVDSEDYGADKVITLSGVHHEYYTPLELMAAPLCNYWTVLSKQRDFKKEGNVCAFYDGYEDLNLLKKYVLFSGISKGCLDFFYHKGENIGEKVDFINYREVDDVYSEIQKYNSVVGTGNYSNAYACAVLGIPYLSVSRVGSGIAINQLNLKYTKKDHDTSLKRISAFLKESVNG